jgi:signal transduction histidine kinase
MTENYILYADLETRRLSGGQGERLLGASGGVEVKAAAMEAAAQRERSGDLALDVAEVRVPVGPAYLRKAVTELVHNAFKFSPQDTPVLVSLACAGAEVLLKVADLGRGLDPEQLRSLGAFQQFDRGRFEQQGSGMGLTLVRGIAEATGGRFTISSRPGQGTTVSILWTASSG